MHHIATKQHKGNEMRKNLQSRQALLDDAMVDEWHKQCEESVKEMRLLCGNSILSAFSENVAVSKMAVHAIRGARGLVDTETLALMDTMSLAFDETSGAIAKLKNANMRASEESAFIVSSLKDIQRKTVEVSLYSDQLERLNAEMSKLQAHIDSGFFDIAAKCNSVLLNH
jgi:hypothetical protein